MIGFGSIAFSHHKGLAGLGMTVAVGMALCMAITLILLPVLKGADPGKTGAVGAI